MKSSWFALTLCLMGLTPVVTFSKEETQESASPVVTLQFRNYHVVVSTSDRGTLYSVDQTDGKRLAEHLTASELQARLPEVHRFVRDAFAGDRKAFMDASNGIETKTFLDASDSMN
jgi:hypothetical protein